ncbi:hypothetical protein CR513_25735, partial [Mucuna pruriens]
MIMMNNRDIESESSSDDEMPPLEDCSDVEVAEPVHGVVFFTGHALSIQRKKDGNVEQREYIFHISCYINDKVCKIIIDNKVVRIHQWLNDCGDIRMTKPVFVSFSIGMYKDEILWDIAHMHARHLLLRRPWQFDRKVTYDGSKIDQISENKQKKEKHKIECNEEKNKKMGAFAKKKEVENALLAKGKLLVLMYKDLYFTNKFHFSLPCEEFTDVFLEEVSHGLPHLRGINHQIDLIPNSSIPNRLAYRKNPKEIKEIQKQVNELLQNGFVKESLSPCSIPMILVLKKDGTWHMCVNSLAINKNTVKYRYPIPRLVYMLDELYGSCMFSKIDLKSGYNQICMKEGDNGKQLLN